MMRVNLVSPRAERLTFLAQAYSLYQHAESEMIESGAWVLYWRVRGTR